MAPKILVERAGFVTTVIINRPEVRNALDREAAFELARALREFDADEQARVAVLCGAGGAFCSGADLKELAAGTDYEPWAGSPEGPLHAPLSKPVIAAVAGHACAGGLGVALWCDLRIAEESASFAVLSRRWGVPMSDGTTVRLPRLIGMSRALDMLLTARIVQAPEAERFGLVNRVVPDGRARAEAEALAHQMAQFPQIAMRSDRQSAYAQAALSERDAVAAEMAYAAAARKLEARAGARRFEQGAGRHGALPETDQE
ncbi:crotonase/enoyl-CoA hydratase family protein [Achromobacter insolitus]|uniref:crotonase/enoyl-CoA hydratase family protein n=1 Tax=Achromobacter insolitus TaxID=217204 RepID=UPI00244EFF4C|nr:crotonase/enoyl-CoA hydratase family protein [Achromobacter insolitus]MDH3066353.1 crotonase/enoyl-CoA hydratase family protein [Achromobacter insolitus]